MEVDSGGQLKRGEKEDEQRGCKPQDKSRARHCVSDASEEHG